VPELHFRVRLPDDTVSRCYSPSTSIRDALTPGREYPVDEFVSVSTAALEHGSRRVAQKYGWGCGHALAQIAEIRRRAEDFSGRPNARVVVEGFEE